MKMKLLQILMTLIFLILAVEHAFFGLLENGCNYHNFDNACFPTVVT